MTQGQGHELFDRALPGLGGGDRLVPTGPVSPGKIAEIQGLLGKIQGLNLSPINALGEGIRLPFSFTSAIDNGHNYKIVPGIPNTRIYIQRLDIRIDPVDDSGRSMGTTTHFAIPNDDNYSYDQLNFDFSSLRIVWYDALQINDISANARRIGFQREYAPVILDNGRDFDLVRTVTNGIAPSTPLILNTDGYLLYVGNQ